MAFDKNGFLWLATKMGIVRFDGRNFREYNTENCPALKWNEYSLPQKEAGSDKIFFKPVFDSSHILTITEDYRIQTDSVVSAAPHQFITSNNHLFFFSAIYKAQALKSSGGAFKQLLDKLNVSNSLITVDESKAYVSDTNHCYFLDENKSSITILPEITGHKLKLQFVVEGIYFYMDDQYRIYAYKDGVLQTNIRVTEELHQFFIWASGVTPDPVLSSLKIRRDPIHTLMVYKDTILLLRMVNNVLDYKILAANTSIRDIKCMIYDDDYKTIYIGTITSGLYVLKIHEFELLFFDNPQFMANSQFAQVELPDGRILTSTGILNNSNKNNILFPDTHDIDKTAWLKASDGAIWYSESDSLKRTDTLLRPAVTIRYLGDLLTGISERENKEIIYSIPHRLSRHYGGKDTILLDYPGLFRNAEIQTIREVSNDNVWIGTSAGLFVYDLSKYMLSRLAGLEDGSISVIYKAKDGSIWIGTYGQGFYKYYKNHFIRMPMDSRRSLVTAHCFMEDRQGYFWIPTNKGLFRVAKKELDDYAAGSSEKVYYYYVDKSYGFSTNEFNGRCTPCGIATRDGRFSLPSLNGLVRFNPDSVHINLPDKPVFIELVTADDKKLLLRDRLVVNRDSSRMIFEVSSPYFGNKFNLHLEYAIKELNDSWYPVNDDGRLIITELGKGEYTLTVRKQDSYAHYTYSAIHLSVLPYWYEMVWFRCLVAALIIGAFLLFFRMRYNYQVKRERLLEQRVVERTEQLSESNRVKELMISIILHDLRSPLRFLGILAKRMYNNYKTSADKELSRILLQFQGATNEVFDFTQNFFVFTNMQKEGFVISRERVVLREMAGDIISFFEVGAQVKKNTFSNLVPEDIVLDTDASLLGLVLRNLADNANKYTSGGEIKIEATQDTAATRIIITDAARRMDEALVAHILNKSYYPSKYGQGWGYKIIIEILTRLDGVLAIDTSSGPGNKITITFEKQR